jgi:hypothetical protein
MGYAFTWDDLERICRKLNMRRQGKTSVWTGIGPDGQKRTCTIHAKHKGTIGSGLINEIAKQQLLFSSVEEMYEFLNSK